MKGATASSCRCEARPRVSSVSDCEPTSPVRLVKLTAAVVVPSYTLPSTPSPTTLTGRGWMSPSRLGPVPEKP